MILDLFGDGGGASAAPAAGGEGTGEAAAIAPGVLDDGTQVDNRLAARMEAQARKRQARGEQAVKPAAVGAAQMNVPQETTKAEPQKEMSLEEEWAEAKKGKYKELFGKDVQNAIQDRFKNQADANKTLEGMQPMLQALMEKAGVQSIEELEKAVLDDDSLYEEEAERTGMTVEAVKTVKALERENERLTKMEQQTMEESRLRSHFMTLVQQAEEAKQYYPNLDLMKELDNPTFYRLTLPGSGVDVKSAYYAVHHDELNSQAMAYGVQRAQQQIAQTMQANRARPTEGAMRTSQGAADIAIDPKQMTRQQRQQLIERARRGEKIVI
jgi:hypothetical protein